MLDAQCTSCRSSFAYHTISLRVRCVCFPCPSQRPLAASPICQRRPTILEPCTPWSLACACNTLQRSRAPSTVCRGALTCCPTPKDNPFFASVPGKASKSTAFSRWLFGSSKSRGENRRRVLAITRELCNMHANASFAALGAPDYAGKSGKAKDRIAKSVKELFANLDAAPRKVPHHSNVYLLCPSVLHCSVLFFALVYSALIV